MNVIKAPNKDQLNAINYLNGPSLIIAGAGTGKTFVLTEKIKKLILEKHTDANSVLALTFTDKAAYEMEERVDQAMPYGYFQSWIMTFHSFADHILRDQGVHIGISPNFKIISEAEAVIFFRNNLSKFKLKYFFSTGNPTGFISGVLQHCSRLRDENITVPDYLKYAKQETQQAIEEESRQAAEKTLELAQIYQTYSQLKLKNNYLDFSDLIYYLVQLLKTRKNILRLLQKQFQYCLVDEFQDTNIVQYDFIKLLFPQNKQSNLTMIGDDNQSIYKFRGASVSNILNFMKDYTGAKMFVLSTNYRSYQEILDSAHTLIKHNDPDTLEVTMGISKKLIAKRGKLKQAWPKLLIGQDGDEEAELIVQKIKQLSQKGNYNLNDFAILVRANDHAKPIIQALERYGINYQFLGPALLYYKSEVRDLIALLLFLNNPNSSTDLYRVLSLSAWKLDNKDIMLMTAYAKRLSRSLFEVMDLIVKDYEKGLDSEYEPLKKTLPILSAKTKIKLTRTYWLLEKLINRVNKVSAVQIIYDFLDKAGYLKQLSKIKSKKDEDRLLNITKFFARLKKIEGELGEATVAEAVENILLALEVGDSPRAEDFDFEKSNSVNILTVHSAKGLEFKVVFLVNLVADRFPTRRRKEVLPIPDQLIKETLPQGDYHLLEERRLFYVGLTRARDSLFLSCANLYGTGKRQKKVSPFILETIGLDQFKQESGAITTKQQQLSIFEIGKKVQVKTIAAGAKKNYLIKRYSYSQINTFEQCPQQYEYRYLLKIPEPDSPALAFGSSVHKALELFYRDIKQGFKPKQVDLLNYYKQNFLPFGYLSHKQRQKTEGHGETLLKQYFQSFHQEHGAIVGIENKFILKFGNKNNEHIVSGLIDRIDKKGNSYEIIDYKTGKKPKDNLLKKSLQLGIYALAVTDKNYLALQPEQITLTFYYLEKSEKFSIKATENSLLKTKEHVIKVLETIEEQQFKTSRGRHCDWCTFKIICPAWNS